MAFQSIQIYQGVEPSNFDWLLRHWASRIEDEDLMKQNYPHSRYSRNLLA